MAYIPFRPKLPLFLRAAVALSERIVGRRVDPARLLAWYPKAAVSSGILESLVAHDEPGVPARLLRLIRVRTSYAAQCTFCVDMNAADGGDGVTIEEARALRSAESIAACETFSDRERLVLAWVDCLTATPIRIPSATLESMQAAFPPREFVIVTTTVAQVNYWTRLIQGLGIDPAGFSTHPDLLELHEIRTLIPPGAHP